MSDPSSSSSTPDSARAPQEAGATVLSLSNSSDVIEQLTEYIADGRRRDGLHQRQGRPVGHGREPRVQEPRRAARRVPAARLVTSPRPRTPAARRTRRSTSASWPPRSRRCARSPRRCSTPGPTCRPGATSTCRPSSSRSAGSTGSPSAPASCSASSASVTPRATDCARQRCETKPGRYVDPTDQSLANAVALAKQERPTVPFALDQARRRRGRPTPTRARWSSTRRPSCAASTLRPPTKSRSSSGSRRPRARWPGSGNGELPEGFLPIRSTGADGQAARRRRAGRRRRGRGADAEPASPSPRRPTQTEAPSDAPPTGPVDNGLPAPDLQPAGLPPESTTPRGRGAAARRRHPPATLRRRAATSTVGSGVAGSLFPLLILLGLVGLRLRDRHPLLRRPAAAAHVSAPTMSEDAEPQTEPQPEPLGPRGRRVARRRRREPVAREPRPGAGGAPAIVSSAFTMVAIVCLWMLAQMLVLSGLSHDRAQDRALPGVPHPAGRDHRAAWTARADR